MRRPVLLIAATMSVFALSGAADAHPTAMTRQDTWHAQQADVSVGAQAAGRDGRGVIVAVLDTWVDIAHPDLQGRALTGADCVGGTCRPGQTQDGCDHGTHVAGTVGSSSFGVAPQVTVLPVRVLSENASGACLGRPEDVAAGIRYALENGAQVINLSLGPDTTDTRSGPLPAAVDAAWSAGAVVVLSAGNGAVPVADVYGNGALVVAATAANAGLAAYSQRGRGIDLAAPGGDATGPNCSQSTCITSLFPEGRYAVAAGTSMAAPLVSGVAALLLAQRPSRTAADVVALLVGTARTLPGAGAGLVDAAAALDVTPAVPRPASPTPPPAATSPPPAPGAPPHTSTSQARPAPVSLGPSTQPDPREVPVGLGVGALLVLVAAGTATVVVRGTAPSPP